jgi:hypothetical protein
MSSDDKYWLCIWSLVATAFITLVVALSVCSFNNQETFIKAVQAGHDPMRVSCAMGVGKHEQSICTIIAERK